MKYTNIDIQNCSKVQVFDTVPFLLMTRSSASTTTSRSLPSGGLLRTTIMADLC